MSHIEQEVILKQKLLCEKYNTNFVETPFNKFLGLAVNSFDNFDMPINGLRHPAESEQSVNWYIWAGKYSDAEDFFQPVHIEHLLQICPKALNYLGLGPGWRFLFDNTYEDVWFDEKLLII